MFIYIIPITALLLTFMALLASMRFIFSRQGAYWIFPAIISLLLFFQNLETLLFIGSQEAGAAAPVPFRPLVLALLWYMMIIVFHYALKKNIPENRFDSDARKNRAEAEYLMKVEMRMAKRRRKAKGRQLGNSTGVPSVPEYRTPEID